MASISILSSQKISVSNPIPKPVIIYPNMGMEEWKECFTFLRDETTNSDDKISYERCLKTLMWAEFCNGFLSYVGNSKEDGSIAVKFTFTFPNLKSRELFDWNLAKNVETILNT